MAMEPVSRPEAVRDICLAFDVPPWVCLPGYKRPVFGRVAWWRMRRRWRRDVARRRAGA